MIRERETARLTQVEAMREQVTRLNGARAKGDKANIMKIKVAMNDIHIGELHERRGQG